MYPGWLLTTPDNVLALFGEPSLEPLREIVLVIGPELIVVQQRGLGIVGISWHVRLHVDPERGVFRNQRC